MLYRVLSLIGLPAYAIDRAVRTLLSAVALPVSAVLLAIIALAASAALSAASVFEALESAPSPVPTSVRAVVRPVGEEPNGWVRMDGLLADTHLEVKRDVDNDGVARPDESLHYYILLDDVDPTAALVVESVRPPEDLRRDPTATGASPPGGRVPVSISGILSSDPRLERVLAGSELARELSGLQSIRNRLFFEGGTPPLPPEPSFVPPIVMAVVAVALLVSRLIGYPVFRPSSPRQARRSQPMSVGEELPLQISGSLPSPHGTAWVHGVPGYLARLPIAELVRKRWQYWGAALGELSARLEAATVGDVGSDRADQLVLHSGHGSVLFPIQAGRSALRVEPGELYTVGSQRAAIRMRGDGAEALLSFAGSADRERALAELTPAAVSVGFSRDGGPAQRPGIQPAPEPWVTLRDRPWQITTAAALFAILGVVAVLGALRALFPDSGVVHPVALGLRVAVVLAVGIGLLAASVGVLRRTDWGRVMMVNLSVMGLVAAVVATATNQVCLQPLRSAGAGCGLTPGLLDTFVGFGTIGAFVFSIWAVLSAPRYFTERSATAR